MAYKASDGKMFTNRPPMKAHERLISKMSALPGKDKAVDPLQPDQQGGGEDPAQVAQEHGPAQAVHIEHDHEQGKHHVHSEHADGHKHDSDHASAEEAHDHAKKLAGLGAEEEQQEEPGAEDEPEFD